MYLSWCDRCCATTAALAARIRNGKMHNINVAPLIVVHYVYRFSIRISLGVGALLPREGVAAGTFDHIHTQLAPASSVVRSWTTGRGSSKEPAEWANADKNTFLLSWTPAHLLGHFICSCHISSALSHLHSFTLLTAQASFPYYFTLYCRSRHCCHRPFLLSTNGCSRRRRTGEEAVSQRLN